MTTHAKIIDAIRRVQSDVDGLLRVDGTVGAYRVRNAVVAVLEETSASEPSNAEKSVELMKQSHGCSLGSTAEQAIVARAQVFATLATGDAILAAAHIIAGEK